MNEQKTTIINDQSRTNGIESVIVEKTTINGSKTLWRLGCEYIYNGYKEITRYLGIDKGIDYKQCYQGCVSFYNYFTNFISDCTKWYQKKFCFSNSIKFITKNFEDFFKLCNKFYSNTIKTSNIQPVCKECKNENNEDIKIPLICKTREELPSRLYNITVCSGIALGKQCSNLFNLFSLPISRTYNYLCTFFIKQQPEKRVDVPIEIKPKYLTFNDYCQSTIKIPSSRSVKHQNMQNRIEQNRFRTIGFKIKQHVQKYFKRMWEKLNHGLQIFFRISKILCRALAVGVVSTILASIVLTLTRGFYFYIKRRFFSRVIYNPNINNFILPQGIDGNGMLLNNETQRNYERLKNAQHQSISEDIRREVRNQLRPEEINIVVENENKKIKNPALESYTDRSMDNLPLNLLENSPMIEQLFSYTINQWNHPDLVWLYIPNYDSIHFNIKNFFNIIKSSFLDLPNLYYKKPDLFATHQKTYLLSRVTIGQVYSKVNNLLTVNSSMCRELNLDGPARSWIFGLRSRGLICQSVNSCVSPHTGYDNDAYVDFIFKMWCLRHGWDLPTLNLTEDSVNFRYYLNFMNKTSINQLWMSGSDFIISTGNISSYSTQHH